MSRNRANVVSSIEHDIQHEICTNSLWTQFAYRQPSSLEEDAQMRNEELNEDNDIGIESDKDESWSGQDDVNENEPHENNDDKEFDVDDDDVSE